MSVALVVIVLASASLTTCADEDDDVVDGAGTGGGVSTLLDENEGATTTTADLDIVMANLREVLDSTAPAIADDINVMGLTSVTPDEVRSVATNLCVSSFDGNVTAAWLDERVPRPSTLLMGPANRLLRLAGTPDICTRPATAEEKQRYVATVYEALPSATPAPMSLDLPTGTEAAVCEVLSSHAGGAAVEELSEALIGLATRNRVDPGDFLPLVVGIAGGTCDVWLPRASAAFETFASSG